MEPNRGAVTSMAYSPDGSLLATTGWLMGRTDPPVVGGQEVLIRDGDTGKVRGRITVPQIVHGRWPSIRPVSGSHAATRRGTSSSGTSPPAAPSSNS